MRCVTCGLPISPVRKNCPRCGTIITGREEKRISSASGVVSSMMQDMFKAPDSSGQDGMQKIIAPLAAAQQGSSIEKGPTYVPPGTAAPLPSWQVMPDNAQAPIHVQPAAQAQYLRASPQERTAQIGHIGQRPLLHDTRARRRLLKRSPRFNLIIATLCILSGAMLLLAVFIISLNLPPTSSQATGQQTLSAPISGTAHLTASPSAMATAQPTVSPTPAFAGQQYIDNAQMASAINFGTAQPLQLTTQFYRNQKIYVTFALHPVSSGAVCLNWYLNNQQFSTFTFPADNVSISAYSYAISGIPGPGYVAIYWASTTQCADQILAQKVNFTVI